MRLDPDDLQVQSFSLESSESTSITVPDTGPDGPHSYCWICYDTDPGVLGCDPKPTPIPPKPIPYDPLNPYRSYVVDSRCLCYA